MHTTAILTERSSDRNTQQQRQRTGWHTSKFALPAQAAMLVALAFVLPASTVAAACNRTSSYTKTNLVSDLPDLAKTTDPDLVNPWGLSHTPKGPWWISDNGTGKTSRYTGEGVKAAPTVSIPSPTGEVNGGTPTGNVFNKAAARNPESFVVKKDDAKGPSVFMFATEDGTIAGWNGDVDLNNAIIAVDRSQATDEQGDVGAVYKGLAIGKSDRKQHIYATNFRFGTVEMFDQDFNLVKSFTDPELTSTCPTPGQCFAPFGIQNIDGQLYVTFALQDAQKHDDQAGPGNGFVDVFSTDGKLVKRLISRGNLNSPWGLALAPRNFGQFSNDLLVGNFGNGLINAYDIDTGEFEGMLKDKDGSPVQTDGLWGIAFGNNGEAGKKNELFFAAGIQDEAHGLFGKITVNDNSHQHDTEPEKTAPTPKEEQQK